MDKKDTAILTVLFMLSFFVWTLPFQQNHAPFGEGDGAYHFAYAHYMSSTDQSMTKLPNFIHFWYYNFNTIIPGVPEYPPSSHLNAAFMQIIGGEVIPAFIYYAITSFFGALTTYFLIRKLFGWFPAALAGFGMAFSNREIMLYLFGQRPTITPFAITPVVVYAYYKFLTSLFSGKTDNKYLYVTTLLLASQFLLHLQALIVTAAILFVFTFMMLVKERRLPVKNLSYNHLGICVLLLIILCASFLPIYLGAEFDVRTAPFQDASRLFRWGLTAEEVAGGYPASFVSFSAQYGSSWMVIPIFVALAYLLIRRQDNKSVLLLSWFAAIYFLFHLDFFVGTSFGRLARLLIAEPMLFFALIALGVFALPRFVKLDVRIRSVLNIALLAVFVLVFVFAIAKPQYSSLQHQYEGISRITPVQIEAAKWINKNLPEDAVVYNYGTLTYGKKRFMLAFSHRYIDNFHGEIVNGSIVNPEHWSFLEDYNTSYYFMFDYSDLAVLAAVPQYSQSAQQQIQRMQAFELQQFSNKTPVYDKNQVRVYEFGT
jgi:hypothetical protein